jgi:heterodisulfide reductase subunit A
MRRKPKVGEPKEEVRIGVYICQCGSNIAATVDTESVRVFAETLPNVVLARSPKYTCSDAGQDEIMNDVREKRLNRVVVAACSPRMHEPTFRRTVEAAGLNPYYFEMANIREHASWIHPAGEALNQKARDLIAAAVYRVARHKELFARQSPVTPAVLIVGGGIAGIQAALDVADSGYQVYLVERDPSIGGHMAQLDKTFPTLDCST